MLAASMTAACAGDGDDPNRFVQVSAGAKHTCALSADHRAWCWGLNTYGALGDGSTTDRLLPTRVHGNLTFDSISAGLDYTCGLTTSGGVFCWGENFGGQLGNGGATNSAVPVQVATSGFRTVSAGEAHTCAIALTATVYCWGAALAADPGGTIPPDQLTPTLLGGPAFTDISSGYEIACAVTAQGAPWCWGLIAPGIHPADTTQISSNTPLPVAAAGVALVRISAASKHACGLTASGQAYCWGQNQGGVLGTGNPQDADTLRAVAGNLVFASIDGHGPGHACGVAASGDAYCWGSNGSGRLGTGTVGASSVPALVSGGLRWASLTTGFTHTCGMTTAGDTYCWGYGGFGQLGTGDTADSPVPVLVTHP